MANTLGEMKTLVWLKTGQTASSSNFSPTVVTDKLNSNSQKILRGRVGNLLRGGQIFRAGRLDFNEGKVSFEYQSGSTLGADLITTDTEITIDPTNYLDDGYVQIGIDTPQYTGKSATQLTGVTGITTDHNEGDRVLQLYELPSYDKVQDVYKIVGNNLRRTPIPYDKNDSYNIYYNLLNSGTTRLLKVVGLCQDDLIEVVYTNEYTSLVADVDTTVFEDDYGKDVVAMLTAGELLFEYNMPNAQSVLNVAYSNLQNMYQFYTNDINVIKQSIRPQEYSYNSVRYIGRSRF